MSKKMILAAKCAPEKNILTDTHRAGICAVELYLSKKILKDVGEVISVCKSFPFIYAVHAPNDDCDPVKLAELVKAINARVVVYHDIFWDDEWKEITKIFKNIETKICVENTCNVHEPLKFMRRYDMGRCLDLEHLQMQCAGVYEEEFFRVFKETDHVHLTGFQHGKGLWHTHIHHSPEHSIYLLSLLKKASYTGFVVSEAKTSLQNYEEFMHLVEFFDNWKANSSAFMKNNKL